MQTLHNKKNCLNTGLFTQICVSETIILSKNMPDIEQIISCVIDPQIMSIKTIETMKGLSYEGQCLTGKKVVIEFKLKQKILYVAEYDTQSVHVIENDFYQSAYIVIPCKIAGSNPDLLIKKNYLKPKIILETISCKPFNKRNIIKNIFLRIELINIPTYEICYSLQYDRCNNDIYMMYDKGTNQIGISNGPSKNNVKPKWSPNGYDIAYLSNIKGNWVLFKYCLKNDTVTQLTDTDRFPNITGFCWTSDGMKICATVYDGNTKELYLIDTCTFNDTQLTYGDKKISSFNPKCSADGKKIGMIRSYADRNDLWIMNTNGTECQKITDNCMVTSFDWSVNYVDIAFIGQSNKNWNFLSIINTKNNTIVSVCDGNILNNRKVKYSSDGEYLAFIGTQKASDNIYLYCIKDKSLKNITQFSCKEQISDFVWNRDDTNIYYSMKKHIHFNIYSLKLSTLCQSQLTFSHAANIELDYRPKIS